LALFMMLGMVLPCLASAAEFITLEDECRGRQMMIKGSIEPGDFQRFTDSMRRLVSDPDLPDVQDSDVLWTVRLDSSGGDAAEAMRIGRYLRGAFATTEVNFRFTRRPDGVYDFQRTGREVCLDGDSRLAGCFEDIAEARCDGACLLVWLGGANRRALEGRLGLHGLAGEDTAVRDYLAEMDVAPGWAARILAGSPAGVAEGDGWLTWSEREALSGYSSSLRALLAHCPEPLSSAQAMESLMTDSPEVRQALLDRAEAFRGCRLERVSAARSLQEPT
jgi:hypothetical protein